MPRMPKDEGVLSGAFGRPISFKDNTSWIGEIYASREPLLVDELWVPAYNFPDYEVSSKGRVRRQDNRFLLTPVPRGKGRVNRAYLRVVLTKKDMPDGQPPKKITVSVHTLIAQTFHGVFLRESGLEVAHLNGNNQDNRADNLRWVTHKENMEHQKAHGTAKTGMQCNLTRLCPNAVFMIRRLFQQEKWSIPRIADLADLAPQVVDRIAKNKSRVRDQPKNEYTR